MFYITPRKIAGCKYTIYFSNIKHLIYNSFSRLPPPPRFCRLYFRERSRPRPGDSGGMSLPEEAPDRGGREWDRLGVKLPTAPNRRRRFIPAAVTGYMKFIGARYRSSGVLRGRWSAPVCRKNVDRGAKVWAEGRQSYPSRPDEFHVQGQFPPEREWAIIAVWRRKKKLLPGQFPPAPPHGFSISVPPPHRP